MPELPTTTRGAATSQRILDAAAAEFADRGIAGARIDRIIAAARTNKAQLYGYFGSKDGLFDAVIADRSDRLLSVIPFDANDLPGWAVGVYDENLRHPELVRLITWLRLERHPEAGCPTRPTTRSSWPPSPGPRPRAGSAPATRPTCSPWSWPWPAPGHRPAASTPPPPANPASDHDRRRALLRDCVERAGDTPLTGAPQHRATTPAFR